MKFKSEELKLQYNENNQPQILLTPLLSRSEAHKGIYELQNILTKGKPLQIEIKQHRQKRSLNANAYLWVLLGKMADVLDTIKDELYLEMLDRYGVFTHIVVKPSVVERVKQEWRTVRELGEVTVNGKTGVQLQCYFGSSTYDTKEMSRLIDGVVSECKELGIETATLEELQTLKREWGNKSESN